MRAKKAVRGHVNSQGVLSDSAVALLAGEISMGEDSKVPDSQSRIHEKAWKFFDPENVEHIGHGPAQFTLVWERDPKIRLQRLELEFTRVPLPDQLLRDVQNAAFIVLKYYPLFALHKKGAKHEIKIRSFIGTTTDGLNFLNWIVQTSRLRHYRVRSLADISIQDIEAAATDYPYKIDNRLATFFSRLSHPLVVKCLEMPPSFTSADIERMNWSEIYRENHNVRPDSRKAVEQYSNLPLHPELFSWLSNTARADVAECLDCIGLEREDQSENPVSIERRDAGKDLATKYPEFQRWWKQATELFPFPLNKRAYRRALYGLESSLGWESGSSSPLLAALSNGQRAAQILVLQYTGMRSGSARLIRTMVKRKQRTSCLRSINGYWMLAGLNKKTRPAKSPLDADNWLTIDCVRDAIRLLEAVASLTGNPYLFGPWKRSGKASPRGHTSMVHMIQGYIADSDETEQFVRAVPSKGPRPRFIWLKGGPPSPARFRHSLVAELARADCGLPMITMQLKHVHSLFTGLSATTMTYGGLKDHAIAKVKGSLPAYPTELRMLMDEKARRTRTAREEVFEAYFNPDRQFAGGGGDAHQARLNEFFVGKGYSESQRSAYIKQLANSGAPLVACGFGYCNKRYAETDEVCKGDLCDPTCHNHVVTEVKIPIIKLRLRNCEEMLSRPEQSHQIPKWRRDREVLHELLTKLGASNEDPDSEPGESE